MIAVYSEVPSSSFFITSESDSSNLGPTQQAAFSQIQYWSNVYLAHIYLDQQLNHSHFSYEAKIDNPVKDYMIDHPLSHDVHEQRESDQQIEGMIDE